MRDNSDLLRAFRATRNQLQETDYFAKKKAPKKKTSPKKGTYSDKISFDEKYATLDKWVDKFKSKDLIQFFITKAEEAGYKYVVANYAKECGMYKTFLTKYTPREICLMIEFVFSSNQNYLDKSTFTTSLLVSGWCNTIYHDALLWADDKYKPKAKKPSREWTKEVDEETAKIGEWEDD